MPKNHSHRRTGYDVTDRIDLSDVNAVSAEACNILKGLYPGSNVGIMEKAFRDCKKLYGGQYPGYRSCEMPYHNLDHVMDVCLAAVRLLDGYEKQAQEKDRLGLENGLICMVTTLFHDSGFIRKAGDHNAQHGAEYTKVHVTRSAEFLVDYLTKQKLEAWIPISTQLVHYTGFEKPLDQLTFEDPRHAQLGYILGTADLIAQMSDRVYLEKCRDFLFKELEIGGLLGGENEQPSSSTPISTPEEFLQHIPLHIQETMAKRLRISFKSAYKYAADHFNGPNLYLEGMGKNFNHLTRLIDSQIVHTLKRKKEMESDHWGQ